MDHLAAFQAIPPVAARLEGADHVDVKAVESGRCLEDVVRSMLTYQPGWLRGLYKVRGWLAKILNLMHDEHLHGRNPDAVNLKPGGQATFFTSEAYEPGRYWLGRVEDNHLDAWLALDAEPQASGKHLHRCATIIRHKKWTGPLYFTIIRPMHHLVVRNMLKYAAREDE